MSADLMEYNSSSDYSSSSSSLDWGQELNTMLQRLKLQDAAPVVPPAAAAVVNPKPKANSFNDLRSSRKVDDVMTEFRMIGSDSPYDPQDDEFWEFRLTASTPITPQNNQYQRQKSWPGAEKANYNRAGMTSSASNVASASGPVYTRQRRPAPSERTEASPMEWSHHYDKGLLPRLRASNLISPEQLAVLQSVPDVVLHALLNDILENRGYAEKPIKKKATEHMQFGGGTVGGGGGECRFCKNNGERSSWVRSHTLKDALGRVACPVLRAFVCRRCGAHGDTAHTIKYCPLSTDHERHMSTALMRSVRLASGRKRIVYPAPPSVKFTNDDVPTFTSIDLNQPLEPVWAALEKKLIW